MPSPATPPWSRSGMNSWMRWRRSSGAVTCSSMARRRKASRTEKQVEHSGDLLMAALGFTAIRFSQARATQQTPGIPDRRYYSPERKTALWWEAKTEIGRQSAFQAALQAMCEAVGEIYVLGTDEALIEWAAGMGYVQRLANGIRVARPGDSWNG